MTTISENMSQSPQAVSLADEEEVKQILVSTVLRLWDVVNNLTRLRPSRPERYRVTIFGSARARPGTFAYEEVKRVAGVLAEMGCDVVTGGGPGLMQAANEGAVAAGAPERDRSVGIRVALPFEQTVNPFVEQVFEHKTFFTRLHHFVLASDAFVVAPGGIVGPMWDGLVDWARTHLLNPELPLADPKDLAIPRCVASADEAVALLRLHHAEWQASAAEHSPAGRPLRSQGKQ